MINIKYVLIIYLVVSALISCTKETDIKPEEPENPETVQQSSDKFQIHHNTFDSLFAITSVVQLSDSSFTLAGGISIDGGSNQNVIVKIDKFGNRDWISIMENTHSPLGLQALFTDENNYIGYRSRTFSTSKSPRLIRFDQSGNVLQEFPIDGSISGIDLLKEDNGFIIAGGLNSISFQEIDFEGKVNWTHMYQPRTRVFSISKLMDGNYISLGGGGYSGTAEHLVKLNSSGEIIWSKPYKGHKVLALPDSGFIAITSDKNDMNLIRFDENGNEKWNQAITDPSAFNLDRGTLNIFDYHLDDLVYTVLTSDFALHICTINSNGELVKTTVLDDIPVRHYFAIIKTLDNGLLIVRSKGVRTNHLDFTKLSYSDLF